MNTTSTSNSITTNGNYSRIYAAMTYLPHQQPLIDAISLRLKQGYDEKDILNIFPVQVKYHDEFINPVIFLAEHLSSLAGETSVIATSITGKTLIVFQLESISYFYSSELLQHINLDGSSSIIHDWITSVVTSVANAPGGASGVWIANSSSMLCNINNTNKSNLIIQPIEAMGVNIYSYETTNRRDDHILGVYEVDVASDNKVVHIEFPLSENEQQINQQGNKRYIPVLVHIGEEISKKIINLSLRSPFVAATYFGEDEGMNPFLFGLFSLFIPSLVYKSSEYKEMAAILDDRNLSVKVIPIENKEQIITQIRYASQVYSLFSSQLMSTTNGACENSLLFINQKEKNIYKANYYAKNSILGDEIGAFADSDNNNDGGEDDDDIVMERPLKTSKYSPVGNQSVIMNSHLHGEFSIGKSSIVIGIQKAIGKDLEVPDCTLVNQVSIQESGESVVLVQAISHSILNNEYFFWKQGYLGMTWNDLFGRGLLPVEHVWQPNEERSFENARLFPIFPSDPDHELFDQAKYALKYLLIVASGNIDMSIEINSKVCRQAWENCPRISFGEILKLYSHDAEMKKKQQLFSLIDELLVKDCLLHRQNICLRPVYSRLADAHNWKIFDILDKIASHAPDDVAARTLAHIGDALAIFGSKIKDGKDLHLLRSGPARNHAFHECYNLLEHGDRIKSIKMLSSIRSEWLKLGPNRLQSQSVDPSLFIRLARHYEGAAAILIRKAVFSVEKFIDDPFRGKKKSEQEALKSKWFNAKSGVRIDIAGGWTDTPPLTFELGGVVTNIAILLNNRRPIGARARIISEPVVKLQVLEHPPNENENTLSSSSAPVICKELSDMYDFCVPSAPGALLKAAIICTRIVSLDDTNPKPLSKQLIDNIGGGIELQSWSDVPVGSGLGTSSILAGCVLGALLELIRSQYSSDDENKDTNTPSAQNANQNMKEETKYKSLIHSVLKVEQMLTTGGGWQDQIGGVYPGAKISWSDAGLPLHVCTTLIKSSDTFENDFNSHTLLVYTGRPRLARNLLQDVIRRWYSRVPDILETTKALVENARAAKDAIESGNLEALGKCFRAYLAHKKTMAEGCETEHIRKVFDILRSKDMLYGECIAGAGGGGFMVLLTKQPNMESEVKKILQESNLIQGLEFFSCTVDGSVGMEITITE